MRHDELEALAAALVQVDGVEAVLLGGSRARGRHTPESDYDLGLYYEHPLDVAGLARLAVEVAGPDARVTQPGAWGPWVDGGAWLRLGDASVDWIYRDLARVRRSWEDARAGRYAFHPQAGHPLGVPGFAYAGEVALGIVLADPGGALGRLQLQTRSYPPELARAAADALWEAEFLVDVARKATGRGDSTYVAGCLFRALTLCAHALHARCGSWVVNEKGVVTEAGDLPGSPEDFAGRVNALLGAVGRGPEQLASTLADASALVAQTRQVCRTDASAP